MSHEPAFDASAAHRHFAVECFNRAWGLIDKPDRTPADDEAMVLTANASLWHWSERPDRTDRHVSIGHWQLSRVYSLLRRVEDAMSHAEQSLKYAAGAEPFFAAYAHEAIARAALLENDRRLMETHLSLAKSLAAQISDPDDRELLDADLLSLAEAAK